MYKLRADPLKKHSITSVVCGDIDKNHFTINYAKAISEDEQ